MSRRLIQVQNRRQLFAAALRYGTLGVLGAAGAAAVTRRRRLVRAPLEIPERATPNPSRRKGKSGRFLTGREGKCINDGVCRGCQVFETCGLPQALSAKQVLARIGNGGK